jgi:peptide deformylase
MKKIVQNGDPVLRQVAQPVPVEEIGSAKINRIIADMSEALASCDDGVAIAAPQIGVPLRIFVVSGQLFVEEEDQRKQKKQADLVFINPKITKRSKKQVTLDEGCLSVRWLYGKTKRSDKVTVEAYDEQGGKFSWSGSGLMAQIFQHETDHLDGVLFIDQARDIQEIKPDEESD